MTVVRFLVAFSLTACFCSNLAAASRPNIVYILADDK